MSLPEPIEPDRDTAPPRADGRADWLCGPDEGLYAEVERKARDSGGVPRPTLLRPQNIPIESAMPPVPGVPAPTLQRPVAPDARPASPERKRFGAVEADAAGSDFVSGSGMVWEPGANSVPAIRRAAPRAVPRLVPARAPGAGREFPMDDAEERSRVRSNAMAAAAAAAEMEGRPHDVTTPDAFDVVVVPMPWWMQAPYVLRSDRRLQLLVGGVVLALALIAFWPRGERPLTLREIDRDPQHFNGRTVQVSGKIGEVFPVGGGFAFYLHQGGDTLVVFTRIRQPQRGQKLTLHGVMSTGFLDGQSHCALFESVSE